MLKEKFSRLKSKLKRWHYVVIGVLLVSFLSLAWVLFNKHIFDVGNYLYQKKIDREEYIGLVEDYNTLLARKDDPEAEYFLELYHYNNIDDFVLVNKNGVRGRDVRYFVTRYQDNKINIICNHENKPEISCRDRHIIKAYYWARKSAEKGFMDAQRLIEIMEGRNNFFSNKFFSNFIYDYDTFSGKVRKVLGEQDSDELMVLKFKSKTYEHILNLKEKGEIIIKFNDMFEGDILNMVRFNSFDDEFYSNIAYKDFFNLMKEEFEKESSKYNRNEKLKDYKKIGSRIIIVHSRLFSPYLERIKYYLNLNKDKESAIKDMRVENKTSHVCGGSISCDSEAKFYLAINAGYGLNSFLSEFIKTRRLANYYKGTCRHLLQRLRYNGGLCESKRI